MVAKKENLFIISCTRVTTSVPHQRFRFASTLPDLFTAVVSVLNTCAFGIFNVDVERPFHNILGPSSASVKYPKQFRSSNNSILIKKLSLTFYLHLCPESGINSPHTSKETSFIEIVLLLLFVYYTRGSF